MVGRCCNIGGNRALLQYNCHVYRPAQPQWYPRGVLWPLGSGSCHWQRISALVAVPGERPSSGWAHGGRELLRMQWRSDHAAWVDGPFERESWPLSGFAEQGNRQHSWFVNSSGPAKHTLSSMLNSIPCDDSVTMVGCVPSLADELVWRCMHT